MSSLRITALWPGMAATWYRGSSLGLVSAVMFSWALSLLLLATFVWTEWLSGWLVVFLWLALFCLWCAAVLRTQLTMVEFLEDVDEGTTDQFSAAQANYLQGNWFEAEAELLAIVQKKPGDIAASLLLVGVFRRTQRWQAALRMLGQVELLDAAASWYFEIHREKQLIMEQMPDESDSRSTDDASLLDMDKISAETETGQDVVTPTETDEAKDLSGEAVFDSSVTK